MEDRKRRKTLETVQKIEGQPSKERFSAIESSNVPALFVGAVKEWAACSLWNPRAGGLDYLEGKVGSVKVEAMLSSSGAVFYGYLGGHEQAPISISEFMELCRRNSQLIEQDGRTDAEKITEDISTASTDEYIYLAQIPIMSTGNKEKSDLEKLIDDIEKPIFLEGKELASINLWMSNVHSRSSIHYDPHHNILCVFSGRKQVFLWPPSVGHILYPMPVHGEAANHSSLDIQSPDFSRYPRAEGFMELSQMAILHSGDALFIPEGWFHQVDSEDLTFAVNFWWQSPTMSSMLNHMDGYYLRIILKRMVEQEKSVILSGLENGLKEATQNHRLMSEAREVQTVLTADDKDKKDSKNEGQYPRELEPLDFQAMNEVLSLVYERVNSSGFNESVKDSSVSSGDSSKNACPLSIIDDPIARALYKMKPSVFRKVFLSVADCFPRTLEGLVYHCLSPLGAEILTTKFDLLDQITSKEQQKEFYDKFYGVFHDKFAAMDSILRKKESFAFQAFRNVLNHNLGVDVFKPPQ